MNPLDADMLDFAPGLLRVQQQPPSPLPRLVMGSLSSRASVLRARRPLTPGMQVAVEVNLGERTVPEYLLSPVQRAFHEAGRER